jgi:endogenous inhibitor of DNA gyrase (YacG/DUF329 family)
MRPPRAQRGAQPAKPRAKIKKCPICGKPATEAWRPFCSEGCKSIDLNRWLSGAYKIPASADDDDDDGKSSGG